MPTFGGGDKLWQQLAEVDRRMSGAEAVEIGFLASARYPDGTSVAMVAAINEYGAPSRGIPPRPFFRNMVQKNQDHWQQDLIDLLRANGYSARVAFEKMGLELKAELQESINDFTSPGNAPSTIARKGFDKPLIDTGFMRDSVDFRVK